VRPLAIALAPVRVRVAEVRPPPDGPATSLPVDVVDARAPAGAHALSSPTGRIVIPRIGLDQPTFEGVGPGEIDQGPSHWAGTALPGQAGNAVFAGHRVTFTRPFYDIDQLQTGDAVILEHLGSRFAYEVTDHFIVGSDAKWIADPTIEATFTLFSCHPKHSYRQRYVVVGRLVTAPAEAPPATSEAPPTNTPGGRACALCLPLGAR
jgi:LPXTG-site transpeptidase (sortase) family protein